MSPAMFGRNRMMRPGAGGTPPPPNLGADEGPGPVPSMEEQQAKPPGGGDPAEQFKVASHYRDESKSCGSCAHFEQDGGECKLGKFTTSEGGGCDKHAPSGEGGNMDDEDTEAFDSPEEDAQEA